jgi:PIN domain nuclease of toxin-antitoxin system
VTTHLLDTNSWLRIVGRPEELNPPTLSLVAAPGVLPFGLSAISIWEVTLKVRKRRLDLNPSIETWLQSALRRSLITVIPIDAEIARAANSLPDPFHEDPADRFVVATARLRDLTVVTSDNEILRYPHVRSLDTR